MRARAANTGVGHAIMKLDVLDLEKATKNWQETLTCIVAMLTALTTHS